MSYESPGQKAAREREYIRPQTKRLASTLYNPHETLRPRKEHFPTPQEREWRRISAALDRFNARVGRGKANR